MKFSEFLFKFLFAISPLAVAIYCLSYYLDNPNALMRHWYLTLAVGFLLVSVFFLWRFYRKLSKKNQSSL